MHHTATNKPHQILLQDISTFDGKDSTKLEEWLTNLKIAADILKESQASLSEAKSHGLTCTLICEALKAEKCWDNIKDIHVGPDILTILNAKNFLDISEISEYASSI